MLKDRYEPSRSSMTTIAVVVTYEPDLTRLRDVIAALNGQVDETLIIENGSLSRGALRVFATSMGAVLIENPENIGLAAAQNQGISRARRLGAANVLLLDQDTVLGAGTVQALDDSLRKLHASGVAVAAVGPTYFDTNSRMLSCAWRARGLFLTRVDLTAGEEQLAQSDFIIASGSLIPVGVFDTVGGMDEELFIDLVDVEWGLRACASGYGSFQARHIVSEHVLGVGRVRLGGRTVPRHAPVRNYFWVRNALLLAWRSYVPLAWRLYFLRRVAAFLLVYPLFADRGLSRLALMARGVRDGLCGRGGPLLGQGRASG